MNRRLFLSTLAGATGALVIPQLWVPERKIFLPPRGGWLQPKWNVGMDHPAYSVGDVICISVVNIDRNQVVSYYRVV